MYKSLNNNRPHRFWCLQEPLMMCSLYKNIYVSSDCMQMSDLDISDKLEKFGQC